ncbi:hypothetical protein MMC19_005044 [Ptychographa xylographoides]|nr:hypothetical protein [Ptychographa xylographoides]
MAASNQYGPNVLYAETGISGNAAVNTDSHYNVHNWAIIAVLIFGLPGALIIAHALWHCCCPTIFTRRSNIPLSSILRTNGTPLDTRRASNTKTWTSPRNRTTRFRSTANNEQESRGHMLCRLQRPAAAHVTTTRLMVTGLADNPDVLLSPPIDIPPAYFATSLAEDLQSEEVLPSYRPHAYRERLPDYDTPFSPEDLSEQILPRTHPSQSLPSRSRRSRQTGHGIRTAGEEAADWYPLARQQERQEIGRIMSGTNISDFESAYGMVMAPTTQTSERRRARIMETCTEEAMWMVQQQEAVGRRRRSSEGMVAERTRQLRRSRRRRSWQLEYHWEEESGAE